MIHQVKDSILNRQKNLREIEESEKEELRVVRDKHQRNQAQLASHLEGNAEMVAKKAQIESTLKERQLQQKAVIVEHDKAYQEKLPIQRSIERFQWDTRELQHQLEELSNTAPQKFAGLRLEIQDVNKEIEHYQNLKPALDEDLKVLQREIDMRNKMHSDAARDHDAARSVLSILHRQHDYAHWQHNETNWDLLEHVTSHNTTAFPLFEKKNILPDPIIGPASPNASLATRTSPPLDSSKNLSTSSDDAAISAKPLDGYSTLDGYSATPRNIMSATDQEYVLVPLLPVTST